MNIRKSAEDYLEQILMIREQKGEVRSIDIAGGLGVTKPSVSVAMKRLRENGYILMGKDNLITLTDTGYEIAEKGDRLPSRRQIAREAGVSAVTADHCYELLCQEGYAEGESRTFIFVLGYAELPEDQKFTAPDVINKAPARRILDSMKEDAQADRALRELREHWDRLLGAYILDAPDEKLRRMVNIWNPYQCMVTFNMSRSASMFESGVGRGMGFRDSSQDLLGFVHQIPERARQRILDIAATQFRDGGCYQANCPKNCRST